MGRGGHLPALRPLQNFADQLDRELQQRLVIKDDAISRLKLLYARLYHAFEELVSKCNRVSAKTEQVTTENRCLRIENVRLSIRNEELVFKLHTLRTKRLQIHELRFIHGLHTKARKKYLSPSAKKQRLLFLHSRQVWFKNGGRQ